jgi:hypothetical protein
VPNHKEAFGNTTLDLHAPGGLAPKTLIKGSTPDTSRLVKHEWSDRVKSRDIVPSFPETNEVLGRWLGPLANIMFSRAHEKLLNAPQHVLQPSQNKKVNKKRLTFLCSALKLKPSLGQMPSQAISLMTQIRKLLTSKPALMTLTARNKQCRKPMNAMPTHLQQAPWR